jgi:PhnB protein
MVNPIPSDYPRVIPYLSVDGADEAIAFYAKVFGAKERMRMGAPGGKIGHAEIEIGDAVVMLADEFPDMGGKSPRTVGGTPVTVMVYVEDVDACFGRALENGATETRKVEDQFYGDRVASSRIRSDTSGMSPATSRTCRRRRWPSAPPPRWAADPALRSCACGASGG